MNRRNFKLAVAALLLARSAAAVANGHYHDRTWHGGEVGVDICYNLRGMGFDGPNWKFAGRPAVPCFAQS